MIAPQKMLIRPQTTAAGFPVLLPGVLTVLLLLLLLGDHPHRVTAFLPTTTVPQSTKGLLPRTRTTTGHAWYAQNNDNHAGQEDSAASSSSADWQILKDRVWQCRAQGLEKEVQRYTTQHPQVSACDFVQQLLQNMYHNEDPLPESGFRYLLRSATSEWKRALYNAVGAPSTAHEDVVASALGEAMGRPNNQYALLVGEADEDYVLTFPGEPLDYYDGTAWVECRLRHQSNNSLLAILGFQLIQNPDNDGAWLVAGMDWQDFRDKFRPGIGREEWMRICY